MFALAQGSVIHRQADLLLAGAGDLAAKWQAHLIAQATDEVVDHVIRDLGRIPETPIVLRKSA